MTQRDIDNLKSAALAIDRVANTMAVREERSKSSDALIEKCRRWCPTGARPSAEEAMVLIAEIDRLREALALALEQKPEDKLYPDTVDRHR